MSVSEYNENISINELINNANTALYFVKENGKNQTVLISEIKSE